MAANDIQSLSEWVRDQTLEIHRVAPSSRVASSLSAVEIVSALFFGGVLRQDPADPRHPDRDRFIASKGHGTLCLYPVLARLGFFPLAELKRVGFDNALLTVIPEQTIPGVETTNGSLGHGPGVACGMALALRLRKNPAQIFLLCGDGEMNVGAVWEAIMLLAHLRMDTVNLIVDDNGRSMLGHQRDIMGLDPLSGKFAAFGWDVEECDGHDVLALARKCHAMKARREGRPKALVAHTVKGHTVAELECDALAHIRVLAPATIDRALEHRKS